MSLRSLAIILPIHLHQQLLESTYATIIHSLPYVSLRSWAQAYVPLHYYRSSVNGYNSLTGFASIPLFRQGRIRSPPSEIHFDTSLEACRLHERRVLRSSSFNQVIDGSRGDSDDPMATETRHSQFRQLLQVPINKSKTPPNEIYRIRSMEKITYRRLQSITNWRRRCNYDNVTHQRVGSPARSMHKVGDDIQVNTATLHDEIHRLRAFTRRSTKRSYG